jgi:hypothetical protein
MAYASREAKIGQFEIVIPNLVIDCRLSDLVIPAKAGIQALPINIYVKVIRQCLTVIGITYLSSYEAVVAYVICGGWLDRPRVMA